MSSRYSIEEVSAMLEKSGYFLLSGQEYRGCKDRMFFYDTEGYLYGLSMDSFLRNRKSNLKGCYRFSTRNMFTINNIRLWLSKNNKSFVLVSDKFVESSDRNLLFRCLSCGKEWSTSWNSASMNRGCPPCSKKKVGLQKRIPLEDVIKKFDENDLKILREEDYCSTEIKIESQCKKCGHCFYTDYHHVASGKSCPKCKSSHGEKRVQKFLDDKGIMYSIQKRFLDCKFKKPLPFDFFLPDYNLCIEYNGQQHYMSFERFGGQEAFEKTKIRDNIKRNFCSNSNIGLIEISYLDFDNIEALLSNILSLKIV